MEKEFHMQTAAKGAACGLRKGRYSKAGRIYLITATTRQREKVFGDFAAARMLVGVLKAESAFSGSRTLAFVVMPDHLHWLMQLGQGELSSVVGRVKSVSARRLGRPVWQAGYHDRAVRREEDLPAIARYVVNNPVRAGLVTRAGDYPHWDAVWL
jgi:REP element-mobilizing transposase RayT